MFEKGDKETVKPAQYESQFNTRERCKECLTHPEIKTPANCLKCGKCVCKNHSLILCESVYNEQISKILFKSFLFFYFPTDSSAS